MFNFAYVVINMLEFFWKKKKKEKKLMKKKKVYRNSSSARKYIFGWSTRTQVSQLNVSSDNSSFFDHKPVLNRVYAGDEHFVNISRFKIYFSVRNLHNLTYYANYFFRRLIDHSIPPQFSRINPLYVAPLYWILCST